MLGNLAFSLRALRRARTRLSLSALAMSIGVASTMLLLALSAGAERAFRESLRVMGENLLVVSAARSESGALRGRAEALRTLTLDDCGLIAKLEGVRQAVPISMATMSLRCRSGATRSTVIGTTPAYRMTNNAPLVAGRWFDDHEVASAARVALLGSGVVREIFHGELPIGRRLIVGGMAFEVIGVLRSKGVDPTGSNQDDRILIPISTAQRRLFDVEHLDRVFVQTRDEAALESVQGPLRALLRERHRLRGVDDFTIRDQARLLQSMRGSDAAFARLLWFSSVLTLSLASLGLFAVTLLAVRERRIEIGLRLTVGAVPRQILGQFLVETLWIALLGALCGLALGTGGILAGRAQLAWQLAVSPQAVALPAMLSLAIGLLAAGFPAWRASRLDPIVALRGE